jgi:hypothetical protein
VLLILLAAGAIRLTEPLDVASSIRVPGRLVWLKGQDAIAYPFHATLGEVLHRLSYPPDAVGVQWVKAAFHVRTQAELDRTVERLASTRRREQAPEEFDRVVCPYSRGGDAIVRTALARAGLDCPTQPVGRQTRGRAPRSIMVD